MNRFMILLLISAALLLAACSSPTGASTASQQEITLITTDLKFQPETIEVTAGQPVKITMRNEGFLEHDFSVMDIAVKDVDEHSHASEGHTGHMASADEPDIHVAAVAGETGTLAFTPTEPGTYEFYCAVPGHREGGMVGTLVVQSP